MAKAFAGGLYNEKEAPKMTKSFEFLPDFDLENPQTFFDIEIGTQETSSKDSRKFPPNL
jgi:hypothetical protein